MQEVACIREAIDREQGSRAVIFDMDGLIFDTERTFMEQLAVVMGGYGYRLTREIYCETLGMAGDILRDKMKGYYGEDYPFQEIGRQARERVNHVAQTVGLAVKPEIIDILVWLKERKLPCAVASGSRTKSVHEYLEITGLREYFQVIVGGEQVQRSKPSPDIFLLAAGQLGIAPNACIVLEDSENGIRAGKAAGCVTVCVPDLKIPAEQYFCDIDYFVSRGVSDVNNFKMERDDNRTIRQTSVQKSTSRKNISSEIENVGSR